MTDEYVNSGAIPVTVGQVGHIDVDYVNHSDETFNLITPYIATGFDGFRGYFKITTDYYNENDGYCVVTLHFPNTDTINIRVSIYTTPAAPTQTPIDWIGGGVSSLSGYKSEDVYVHNDVNRERCYLYNTRKSSEVKIVTNKPPVETKVFDSLEYKSNKSWDVPLIEIPADASYPNGMQSLIPESRFKVREGIFSSDFLRNMKTNQSTATNIDLLKGEELRGPAMEVTLVNDDTEEVNLFSVTVNSSKSRS
jgi:hypothetical protein